MLVEGILQGRGRNTHHKNLQSGGCPDAPTTVAIWRHPVQELLLGGSLPWSQRTTVPGRPVAPAPQAGGGGGEAEPSNPTELI